ncbi:MAG TPA: anthranilate synthase component I [Chloroflexota bacterium]|nr:anthranilate synthase component I [Chloroflexota bacterium]
MTSRPSTEFASLATIHTPSLDAALSLRHRGSLLPVYRECIADTETPVSAYVKLRGRSPSFLLESVEGGERQGRYSIIATHPRESLRFLDGEVEIVGDGQTRREPCPDPLAIVDERLKERVAVAVDGLPRFHGGALGYLGFDLIRAYEEVGPSRPAPYDLPLGQLAICDTLVVFDHVKHTIKVVSHVPLQGDVRAEYAAAVERIDAVVARLRTAEPLASGDAVLADVPSRPLRAPVADSNMPRSAFEEHVSTAKDYIAAGDIFQVVLAQRFAVRTRASALAIYRALRMVNPSPYMYLLDFGDYQLVGSSPELLVLVDGDQVSTHPIAGSRPRGATREEDDALERELLANEKERAEHVMLVDLGRNDIGRVCVPGTVHVDNLMSVERYSHVMHIVSNVVGRLRKDLRPIDALRACFPAGTLSGAPKIRAMQIISELEPEGRGAYGGAIGFFGYNGNLETAITIRTAIVRDGVAHVQAGAGIVADSDPAAEYDECVSKAQALLTSVQLAEGLTARPEGGRAEPLAPAAEMGGIASGVREMTHG